MPRPVPHRTDETANGLKQCGSGESVETDEAVPDVSEVILGKLPLADDARRLCSAHDDRRIPLVW